MEILHHYCSINSFLSIIESKSIHLSALNMSNDALEGRLVSEIITKLANNDELDDESIGNIKDGLSFLESVYDGLGFCLSEKGDLLSQWRGYASDAKGFSIGFSKDYLVSLSELLNKNIVAGFNLKKVEYIQESQEALVKPTYSKIKEMVLDCRMKTPHPKGLLDLRTDDDIAKEIEEYKNAYKSMIVTMYKLIPDLYALKTAAFSEENEWRLISYVARDGTRACEFKSSSDQLIPFRSFELKDLEIDAIQKVILGPKNKTPIHVVSNLLEKNGFKNVEIKTSEASYR